MKLESIITTALLIPVMAAIGYVVRGFIETYGAWGGLPLIVIIILAHFAYDGRQIRKAREQQLAEGGERSPPNG